MSYRFTSYILRLIAIGLVLFSAFSCTKPQKFKHLEGNALGTTFSIIYDDSVNYSQSIDTLFDVVNASLSTYHPNSLISKINNGDSLIRVDKHFITVFNKAKKINKETDTYFDPTVGVLVNAWGFGPKKALDNLDSLAVKNLMKYVGFEKITLKNKRIIKKFPAIFIDFNAIAKGYTVDVLGRFLESKNIENYMVEIGGEVRVRGINSRGKSWVIAIEKPLTDGTRAYETTISLQNKAMATSGNYRKYKIDKQGRKYVHTINPKTGFTAQNDLLSATVITTRDCADADAYATAFMAMGYKKTKAFLEKHKDLQTLLIYVDEQGAVQVEENY